ncbi:MAG: ADP-ribosylglycohydrolase family protein [Clostridia bacterium]|nr:ADP-ribosylglycohydrolase family protein [Clostridia bacterium]
MIIYNRATLRDKIYACWVGKNIGGTMGGPFEGSEKLLNIEGFTTPEGTVLPNDDLDLQIIWLKALEERGPRAITGQLLGEYWLNFIPPTWNEYGIGKSNLIMGLLPPLSGEYQNYWKNSNGAWIRSEVWACCAPGCPDIAIKYAVEDAMVDHGMAEGTYAEIFTAAIESAAFVCNDIQKLIKIGLSKIPANCRVAQAVRTVVECHAKNMTWKETREKVLNENRDLGWFQAPGNIAFVVIGLLYGNCDFKQSMLIAINCGDDTDCTGATVGALLGIMGGMEAIPQDWRKYIGDNIITVAINRGDTWGCPQTCTELTDRVLRMTPEVLRANYANLALSDGPEDLSEVDLDALCNPDVAKRICARSGWSYEVEFIHSKATVIFEGEPKIAPNGELRGKLSVISCMPDPRNIEFNWILPEGWSVRAPKSVYLRHWYNQLVDRPTIIDFTITAGEQVDSMNRIVVEAKAPGRPTVGYIPVTVLG